MKARIGELIELKNETNVAGLDLPFYGLNKDKTISPTVANVTGVDNKKYKILRKGYFAINGMHAGRDNALAIGYWNNDGLGLVSPAYTTFSIKNSVINPEYFFMIFNSKEMDRYCGFLCDSSIRGGLDWNIFCNIEIDLPPLEIQKKYVDVYNSLIQDQKSYEKRLDNLKLACNIQIENLKNQAIPLYGYIEQITQKNELINMNAVGISKSGFIKPKVDVGELKNYFVVKKGDFVYSPPRINIGSIELYKGEKEAVCSPIYVVFRVKDENKLNSDYLNIWLHREEFFRSTEYYSVGSVRNNFTYEQMEKTKIAIPAIEIQNATADLYVGLNKCQEINNKLKEQIQKMCPILIKGATEEAANNL